MCRRLCVTVTMQRCRYCINERVRKRVAISRKYCAAANVQTEVGSTWLNLAKDIVKWIGAFALPANRTYSYKGIICLPVIDGQYKRQHPFAATNLFTFIQWRMSNFPFTHLIGKDCTVNIRSPTIPILHRPIFTWKMSTTATQIMRASQGDIL